MSNINGVNPPLSGDPAYYTKVSESLQAIKDHDHSDGKGAPVKRIAPNVVGTDNIVDEAVVTDKIKDGAVTLAKLGPDVLAKFGNFVLMQYKRTKTLYGAESSFPSFEPIEVLTAEVVPVSDPIELNDLRTGDIVELFLVPSAPLNPSHSSGFLRVNKDNRDHATGEWGVFDSDNNFLRISLLEIATEAGSITDDPVLSVPCYSIRATLTVNRNHNASFRLGHSSGPFSDSTVGTVNVALCAKVYRPA